MEVVFVSVDGVIRPDFAFSLKELQKEVKSRSEAPILGAGQAPSVQRAQRPEGRKGTSPDGIPWEDFYGPNALGTKYPYKYSFKLSEENLAAIFNSHRYLSLLLEEPKVLELRKLIYLTSEREAEIWDPFFSRKAPFSVGKYKYPFAAGFQNGILENYTPPAIGRLGRGKWEYSIEWKEFPMELGQDEKIRSAIALPNDMFIVSTGSKLYKVGKEAEQFEVPSQEESKRREGEEDFIYSVAVMENLVIGGTDNNTLLVWDLTTLKFLKVVDFETKRSPECDPEETRVAVFSLAVQERKGLSPAKLAAGTNYDLYLIDLSDLESPVIIKGDSQNVHDIAFLPDGRIVTRQWNNVKVYTLVGQELVESIDIPCQISPKEDLLGGLVILEHSVAVVATKENLILVDIDQARFHPRRHTVKDVKQIFALESFPEDIKTFNAEALSLFTEVPKDTGGVILKFITG